MGSPFTPRPLGRCCQVLPGCSTGAAHVLLRCARGSSGAPQVRRVLRGAPPICTGASQVLGVLYGCSAGAPLICTGAPQVLGVFRECSVGAPQVRGVLPGCSGVLLRSAQVLRGCSTGLHGACPGAPAPLPRVAQDSRSPGAVFTGGANPQPHHRKGPFSSPGSASLPQSSNFCPSTCRELGRRTHPSGKPSGVTEGADACSLGPRSRRTYKRRQLSAPLVSLRTATASLR